MAKSHHPLIYAERCQIYAHKASGLSYRDIVRLMGRSHTTISREFGRNSGKRGYRHKQAQEEGKGTLARSLLSTEEDNLDTLEDDG